MDICSIILFLIYLRVHEAVPQCRSHSTGNELMLDKSNSIFIKQPFVTYVFIIKIYMVNKVTNRYYLTMMRQYLKLPKTISFEKAIFK